MAFWFDSERFAALILFVFVITQGTDCLEITRFSVPRQVTLGKGASLTCKYSLQGDKLYSLTWLKDGQEFLKIRPGYPTYVYQTRGVFLKVDDPGGSVILLWKTDILSEGEYACEVTGEAPRFITALRKAPLSVIALPKTGPRIKGGKDQYIAGDQINVTCISGPSYPPANLTWYINDHRTSGTEEEIIDIIGGLKLSKAKLDLKVEPKHLVSGELKLKCLATILDLYWNSSEQPPKTEFNSNGENEIVPSFLSHLSHSAGVSCNCSQFTIVVLMSAAVHIYWKKIT